ncbi:MAG: tetratricopeptide repeat protein [Treponema sp.]|nr:tetratricopeptide repeat protein [Treponema sp.]MCR5621873.1 tetratricopeptide repeat protein [Treponema sp.]
MTRIMGSNVKRLCLLTVVMGLGLGLCAQTTVQKDALQLYRNRQYDAAIAICEQEIKANPANMDAYSVLIWSLLRQKRYLQAEEKGLQARKENSYDIRIIEALGEAEYYLGKNDAALSYFQRYVSNARESEGDYVLSYYYMGEIYIKQSKFQHADIALTTAVRNKPERADYWTRLGYAREMCKEYTSAIEAYDKALSLNANLADAKSGKERCQSRL